MIFDIIGIVDFNKNLGGLSLDHIFHTQIYENIEITKGYKKWHNFQFAYLFRDNIGNSLFENDNLCIIVVGEVFLNLNGIKKPYKAIHPLSVQEIFEYYRNFELDVVHYLKGNFQIVIFDKKQKSILILNNRFGISPFYYSFVDNTLIFSTNLQVIVNCGAIHINLDKIGVAEYAIFGYPLGNRTIFEDIRSLPLAAYLIVKEDSIEVKRYWDCKNLLGQKLYSEKEALEIGSDLFKKIVNQYTQQPDKVCLSLTGGFDCRAILSVLEKSPQDFICYSFGIPGSLNISIPQKICKENNINYLPIYLDEKYEKVFNDYALQAIYLSDCLSTFERANYPYAFKKLSEFSPVVITGIFGSELMRTFQNVALGYMVNENFVKINFAVDKKSVLSSIIKHTRENSYYSPQTFGNFDELLEHTYEQCFKKYEGLNDNQKFYLFLLNEGVRKYFGGEVQTERIYAFNRFPFLDDEFVEFVFKSPFSGIYTDPLKPTIKQRLNSQVFYAYVIRRYRSKLLNYATDHGYPPKYLLSKIPLLQIGPSFLFNRMKQRLTGHREFKTEEWSENFYKEQLLEKPVNGNIFSKRLQVEFASGLWKKRRIDFARAASLKLYLELLQTRKDVQMQL